MTAGSTRAVNTKPPGQIAEKLAGRRFLAEQQRQYVKEDGRIIAPVDAVRTPDGIVTIDNTRVAVAREHGLATIPVRVWEPSDPLPPDMQRRFKTAQNWGEALKERLMDQRPSILTPGTTEIPRLPERKVP